ncbi:MAG TPA: membrane protein insertase YidC [Candidatus Baltobacteraceae bacterium]
MHLFLGFSNPLIPVVNVVYAIISFIHAYLPGHNWGWSLVIFALLFKLAAWKLNVMQFNGMMNMQKIGPKLKALQTKYGKSDPQKYQQETMALYKESGANPMAGCWPMLIQYPVILSVYYAVIAHREVLNGQKWLWVGSAASAHSPHLFGVNVLATSLAAPDAILLVLYMISMYLYSRYATMASPDPAMANQQKIMAIMSPVLLGVFGFKYQWPSAMVLYWFAYNAFTMAQQFYLLRKYHQPLSMLDNEHAVTELATDGAMQKALVANANGSKNGSKSGAAVNGANKNKKRKGAKK